MRKYSKKGQAGVAVGAIITLIVGIGVSVMVFIFVNTLGGETYKQVEGDIDSINDTAIRNAVSGGIQSSFEALEETGEYLPIIVLAVVISLVLMLVLGFTSFGGSGNGGGAAL